jgi:hypothetical protein
MSFFNGLLQPRTKIFASFQPPPAPPKSNERLDLAHSF